MNQEASNSNKLDIHEMQTQSKEFIRERDWEKFHTPKNIAIGIAIEAAELIEIFHWLTDQESQDVKSDPPAYSKVKDEIGDILHYLIRLADVLDIDINEAYWQKFKKTKNKYPAERVKGSAELYAKLH